MPVGTMQAPPQTQEAAAGAGDHFAAAHAAMLRDQQLQFHFTEFTPPQKIRTLAYWSAGKIVDNIEYDLPGTPCERVIHGDLCHIPSGVQAQ